VFTFQNKPSILDIISIEAPSILSHFPQYKESPGVWVIQDDQIDYSIPWAHFDGASQNKNQSCGEGAILFISSQHFFKIKMVLGPRTNNYEELLALNLMLSFIGEK